MPPPGVAFEKRRVTQWRLQAACAGYGSPEEATPLAETRTILGILYQAAHPFSAVSRCEPQTARKVMASSSVLSALITGNSRLFLIML